MLSSVLLSSSHHPNKYLPFEKPLSSKSPVASKVHEIISNAWGFKHTIFHNPSPNPISLERKYLPQLESEISDFVVAEKSDGVRYLMVIGTVGQKGFCVMVNRKMQMFEVPIFANSDFFKGSVFDGEMVVESLGREHERQKFLVYDLVSVHGETRRTKDFLERYNEYFQIFDLEGKDIMDYDITKWESDAYELANSKAKIVCLGNKMALQFAPKPFVQLIHVGSLWRSIPKLKHSSDGLVITRVSAKIGTGTDPNILKWKENHTIDLIVTCNFTRGKWSSRIFFQDNEKVVESTDRLFDLFGKKYALQMSENATLRSTCQYYAETHKTQFSLIGECLCVFHVPNIVTGATATSTEVMGAPPSTTDVINCSVLKWRRDKYTPNNSTVIQRTLGNIIDNVLIDELIQMTTKKMYSQ